MTIPHIRRRSDLLATCVILLCISIFHARGLRPGYAFLPIDNVNNNRPWRVGPFVLGNLQNQLIGDPIYQFYPFLVHAVDSVKKGLWPLWNTQLLLGHPSVGDPLAQTFYPVFIGLGLAFGPARGLTFGFWLHAVLAGCLTYGWLRSLGRTIPAAVLGAITYALGGYMVTWFETTFWVSTLSWLPGVLWMAERSLQNHRFRDVAFAALMLGLAILAGQFSFVVFFILFLIAYLLGRTWELARINGLAWKRSTVITLLTLGLGTAVGAAQLLPFAEALQQSHRAGGVAFSAVPFEQMVTFVVPNFYGNPSTTGAYWGAFNFSEGVMYTGGLVLLLALSVAIRARVRRSLYWLALGIATIYFAYGGPGSHAIARLPILDYLMPHRCLFIIPLIGAVLAAEAVDEDKLNIVAIVLAGALLSAIVVWPLYADWGGALGHWTEIQGAIGTTVLWLSLGIVVLLIRERWPMWRAGLNWALVGLVFLDLYVFGSRYNPALPLNQLPQPTPAIKFLQANTGTYRVATRQVIGDIIFGPNYLTVFGIPDLNGYSSLLPARLIKLVRAGDPNSMGYNGNAIWLGQPSSRLLDLLQARYVVSILPSESPTPHAERLAQTCIGQTPEITNSNPLTGTLVVHDQAINRLDISFRVSESVQPALSLTVRMWRGERREQLVLDSEVAAGQLQDNQNSTFYFAPEKDAPGQTYVWEIGTKSSRTGISVCANANGQPEFSVYGIDHSDPYQGELNIMERLAPLPRAYVVYAAETIAEDDRAVNRLFEAAFDIRNVAVTATPINLPTSATRPATGGEIQEYGDIRVIIKTRTLQDGLLVLGDYDYPGWVAYIDGKSANIIRANLIWRGVKLPPGDHTIIFQFEPLSLKIGLWISSFGILLIGVLILRDITRPKFKRPTGD